MSQTADPAVSRSKFDREVGRLRSSERLLVGRGIWVTEADFPIVKVAFMTPKMWPRVMATAIRVDYSDYDVRPPSLKFWDPFDDRELMPPELLTHLKKRGNAFAVGSQTPVPDLQIPVPMVVSHGTDQSAFLCLPGLREYHDHPAHTGDAWELHRRTDGGSLFDLVETIWRYGSGPVRQFSFQIGMQLEQAEVPE